jgi:cytochrome d ubiquinol oxidase subunit I
MKIAAMEGHFESLDSHVPLILFGIPDAEEETVHYKIEIPDLGSLILRHDVNLGIEGLDTVPPEDRPPVGIVFWAFRIMVGLGFLMAGLGLFSLFMRWCGKLYSSWLLHRFALVMGPAGFVAVISGWVVTEVGRQPWVIYNVMRTEDAVSAIGAPGVTGSLIAFVVVYFSVFSAGTWYILKLMSHAPGSEETEPEGPIRTAGITPAATEDKAWDRGERE